VSASRRFSHAIAEGDGISVVAAVEDADAARAAEAQRAEALVVDGDPGGLREATSLPILVYNIQGRTAVNVETDTMARLARDCKNIV